MTSIRRLLVGNLDCELRWAGHERLPRDVTAMVSAAAVGMRAFAEDGDRLWTLAPVDPSRVASIEGLPDIELISGELPPAEHVLAWGETRATEKARNHIRCASNSGAWWDQLWTARCEPEVVRAVNDRRFGFEATLTPQLPGARILGSLGELESHLASGAADLGLEGAWVLKAPLSASGRLRLRRRGVTLDAAARKRAERLFRRWESLLFEPWMERIEDFGQCGIVTDEAVTVFAPHRLLCHRAGVFRAAIIDDAAPWEAEIRDALQAAAEDAGSVIRDRGYRGAFGIDAYTYRASDGERRLQALSEINARVSFGVIARALAERLGHPHLELHLGRGAIPQGDTVTPLVHPGDEGTALWFRTPPP